mmetsp:Transcript_62040/g.196154  ORF Transcript_62040/g.196154 Transcript_62040/m.196154 type:complete len:225 (-) Transcript_62040:216-890(-)
MALRTTAAQRRGRSARPSAKVTNWTCSRGLAGVQAGRPMLRGRKATQSSRPKPRQLGRTTPQDRPSVRLQRCKRASPASPAAGSPGTFPPLAWAGALASPPRARSPRARRPPSPRMRTRSSPRSSRRGAAPSSWRSGRAAAGRGAARATSGGGAGRRRSPSSRSGRPSPRTAPPRPSAAGSRRGSLWTTASRCSALRTSHPSAGGWRARPGRSPTPRSSTGTCC